MSGSRLTSPAAPSVRYRERLWVPWWWWPVGVLATALITYNIDLAVRDLPKWLPFVALCPVAAVVLLWLGRIEIRVTSTDGLVELWAGAAHLPAAVIARCAEVPRSAKSAALGRQLDPAAYVVHRGWVGPMLLLVLDDPDDPTPYWLVSCRHPQRALTALSDAANPIR